MNFRLGLVSLSAALLLVPGWLGAATKTCTAGAPTAESYTWDFAGEASELLERLQLHAAAISRETEGLELQGRFNGLSSQTHGEKLMQVRQDVNSMGKLLCRLHTIQREILPWQLKALERIEPGIRTLAANTEAAIEALNNNQNTLFASAYPNLVGQIREGSERLSDSVGTFREYAKVKEQYHALEQAVEMSGT
jgi:hypothetical protein